MKKIAAILFVFWTLLGSLELFAQINFPDFSQIPEWYVYGTSNAWGGIFDTEILQFEKDTILCGKSYSKININKGNLCGIGKSNFIRTENQKVYYKADSDCAKSEKLLYDFSLNAGDSTYCAFKCNDSVIFHVDAVETINYLGIDRKKMNLRFKESPSSLAGYYYMSWIEGIGSLTHPFYPTVCILDQCESFYELTCAFASGQQQYQNPNYFSCDISFVEETESPENMRIYPNPTREKFDISCNEEIKSLTIYDFSGKQLITAKKIASLSHYQLANGTYWVQIQTVSGIYRQKLIVQ